MLLGRKLFRTQFVRCRDFRGKGLSLHESKREQGDTCDERVIGHHHCDCSKKGFQVIRKLRSTSVSRVHRDEAIASEFQGNERSVKIKSLHLPVDSHLDALELLGDDRKDVFLNTIELVEAGPSTTGGESLEEFIHLNMIHLVGAIENDALPC